MISHVVRFTLMLILMGGMALGQSVILGVLEDVSEEDPNLAARAVRVVFQKDGPDWKAFPSDCPTQGCLKSLAAEYPQEITWAIAFDGKSMGQITGRTPREFSSYSKIGLQNINNARTIPVIGKKSSEYSGSREVSVYRPLVANSRSYFRDPELWKPRHLSAELIRALHKGYRQKFPRLCKASEEQDRLVPFAYRDDQIKVIKNYGSNKGWEVARIHLSGAIDCSDTEAGSELSDQWFVVDPRNEVRYLGEGMWLVDAGDYDNDGKSELLFSITGANRGGYELFYDDFRKHATFEFSYH